MADNLISIIIPVHNAEKYIERCLDSVINQTYKNVEILCIINGCTDKSKTICQKYSEKYRNVLCFDSEKGVCIARNLGLSNISGDWFAFVDSDDWLEPNYCELLLKNALENETTISACSFFRDYEYNIRNNYVNEVLCIETPGQCVHNYICSGKYSMNGMVWNKLYKASVYKNFRFDETLSVNEDCMYTYYVLSNCDVACVSSAKLYHWFQRDDSACHKKSNVIDLSAANVFISIMKETENLEDSQILNKLKCNYVKNVINTIFHAKKSNCDELTVAKLRCKKWKKEVWHEFDSKTKIKYCISMIK